MEGNPRAIPRWRIAMHLMIASLGASLSTSAVLAPWLYQGEVMAALHIHSLATFGWVLFAAELGNCAGLTLWGPMGDFRDRRKAIVAAFVGSGLLMALMGGVPMPAVVFMALALPERRDQPGRGVRARPDQEHRLAGENKHQTAFRQGVMSMLIPFGFLCFRAPVLLPWRTGFLVIAALSAVFALLSRTLPDDRESVDREASLRAVMTALVKDGWTCADVLVPGLIGFLGGVGFRAVFAVQPALVSAAVTADPAGSDLAGFDVARQLTGASLGTADLWILGFQLTNVAAAVACLIWGGVVSRWPRHHAALARAAARRRRRAAADRPPGRARVAVRILRRLGGRGCRDQHRDGERVHDRGAPGDGRVLGQAHAAGAGDGDRGARRPDRTRGVRLQRAGRRQPRRGGAGAHARRRVGRAARCRARRVAARRRGRASARGRRRHDHDRRARRRAVGSPPIGGPASCAPGSPRSTSTASSPRHRRSCSSSSLRSTRSTCSSDAPSDIGVDDWERAYGRIARLAGAAAGRRSRSRLRRDVVDALERFGAPGTAGRRSLRDAVGDLLAAVEEWACTGGRLQPPAAGDADRLDELSAPVVGPAAATAESAVEDDAEPGENAAPTGHDDVAAGHDGAPGRYDAPAGRDGAPAVCEVELVVITDEDALIRDAAGRVDPGTPYWSCSERNSYHEPEGALPRLLSDLAVTRAVAYNRRTPARVPADDAGS